MTGGTTSYWAAAIDQIYQIVRDEKIDCDFKWVPGYLHASLTETDEKDRTTLEEDAQLASQLGFDVQFVDKVPYANRPGIRFSNQAKFHPLKYLAVLLERIQGDGSYVFENTEASQIDEKPLTVHAGRNKIRCDYLMIATHTPL